MIVIRFVPIGAGGWMETGTIGVITPIGEAPRAAG
jgi:hypothetical protein